MYILNKHKADDQGHVYEFTGSNPNKNSFMGLANALSTDLRLQDIHIWK